METSNHQRKLSDPRWQQKRLMIMQRDSFTCLKCTDTKTELQVHHKTYTGNPWDAPEDDLETLCAHCHKAESEVNKTLDTIIFAMKTETNYFCKTRKGFIMLGKYDAQSELEVSMVIKKPKEFIDILKNIS